MTVRTGQAVSHALDLHLHSLYSDGKVMPAELVATIKRQHPEVEHLALSDHDTFLGCPEFVAACRAHAIEGFVSAEIGGSHPRFPHIEFHFLVNFGRLWSEEVGRRTAVFLPYWNEMKRVDLENVFLFLEASRRLGQPLSFRDVSRKAAEAFARMPEPKDLAIVQPPGFGHLRMLLRELGLETGPHTAPSSYEKRTWEGSGLRPRPSPFITEAYGMFREARPVVTLAHPMLYAWRMEEALPLLEEWKREINLAALEAHYGGRLSSEWKRAADDLDLLCSVGSDSHRAGYSGNHPHTKAPLALPVVGDEIEVDRLLELFRGAE